VSDDALVLRVTVLEQRVDRLEAGIADLRAHTDAGFLALRSEIVTLRTDMQAGFDSVHQELARLQTQRDEDFRFLNGRLDSLETRMDSMEARMGSIEDRIQSVNTRISVLHEDIVDRLTTLGELWTRPRRTRRKKE